jgi:hypothetical protein
MANETDLYQQVIDNIAAGDPMAAYQSFTKLPFRDQMGLYMTPGVGDAIAFVESADLYDKAGRAKEEGRYGDMLGFGTQGLIAQASMLPFLGSAVDAGRVGSKTLERGIGNLMNRVNTRMDSNIPGGGGGSRGGGSGPFDEIYKLSDTKSADFTQLPEEVIKPVNLNIRKTGDSTFDVDAKSFRIEDFDVNNKSNAVIAKHFEDMGFDKNSIRVFDDDTTGFEDMAKLDFKPDPGSVKNYTFRLENGEEAIDKVKTFTVDGKPVGLHYGSDPYIGGFSAYFIPKQGATASRGVIPEAEILAEKAIRKEMINKSEKLKKLMRERETEYQYMTPNQISALDARINKLRAELTASRGSS